MKFLSFLFSGLLVLSIFSCGKSDSPLDPPNEVSISDFVGTWKASSAVFTNNSNTSESIDYISAGGEIRFTMLEDGRLRTWVDFQDNVVDEWDAIAKLENGNELHVTPAESSRSEYSITFELDEDETTFTNTNSEFDFTLSGQEPVSCTSVIEFKRQ